MEGGNPHQCGHCHLVFSSWSGLVVHLRTTHATDRPYKCSHCTVEFNDIDSLIVHIRNHSSDKLGVAVQLVKRMQKRNRINDQYIAVGCVGGGGGGVADNATGFKSEFVQPESSFAQSYSNTMPSKCGRCGLWPPHAMALSSDANEIMCQCPPENSIINGIPIIFGDKPVRGRPRSEYLPFKCPHCHAGYAQKGNLKVHMRLHTGERPYVCTWCSAAYAQKSNLKAHMRVHTGERPYKCNYCDAAFAQKSNLTTHMRKHTGEKPFKCTQCSAVFAQQCNLRNHYRTHSDERPYKCTQCDAAFVQKGNLTAHLRMHSGDKPFKCGECSAAFFTNNQLTKHMKSHPL